jgi:hypothetical protein
MSNNEYDKYPDALGNVAGGGLGFLAGDRLGTGVLTGTAFHNTGRPFMRGAKLGVRNPGLGERVVINNVSKFKGRNQAIKLVLAAAAAAGLMGAGAVGGAVAGGKVQREIRKRS